MAEVVLIIHLILTVALIAMVLIQRSEGGGLGIGGGGAGGGGIGNILSSRGTANLLTRTTTILAAAFMTTSILLAIFAAQTSNPDSLLDQLQVPVQPEAAIDVPAETDAAPTTNDIPKVPIAE